MKTGKLDRAIEHRFFVLNVFCCFLYQLHAVDSYSPRYTQLSIFLFSNQNSLVLTTTFWCWNGESSLQQPRHPGCSDVTWRNSRWNRFPGGDTLDLLTRKVTVLLPSATVLGWSLWLAKLKGASSPHMAEDNNVGKASVAHTHRTMCRI